MDLEGDETVLVGPVQEVGAGNPVHPGADAVADSLDAGTVPAVVIGFSGGLVLRHAVQPHAAGFVVDAAAPCPGSRIDLELITIHQAALVVLVAADLHAGIDALGEEVEFQDKVSVILWPGKN